MLGAQLQRQDDQRAGDRQGRRRVQHRARRHERPDQRPGGPAGPRRRHRHPGRRERLRLVVRQHITTNAKNRDETITIVTAKAFPLFL